MRIVGDNDNKDTIKLICRFTKDLGSHIRFLESASHPRIPWAVIAPMEKLITSIVPGAKIVLRSQWSWNYRVRQMSELYKQSLDTLARKYLEDSVFEPGAPAWNVVSLPRIDADNVLMHVILGHEVGHRIAERFLAQEDAAQVQADIATEVGDVKWAEPAIAAFDVVRAIGVRNRVFKMIEEIRRRGIEELISDVVALQLFGPAFIFTLRVSSLDGALDEIPTARWPHPPWRYRYRHALAEYERLGYRELMRTIGGLPLNDQIRDACEKEVRGLEELASRDDDIKAIDGAPFAKRAYGLITKAMATAPAFVESALPDLGFVRDDFKPRLEERLGLLALGIPPAPSGAGSPDFRYAVLAGWCYRTAQLPVPVTENVEWDPEDDDTLQRLVHKALEYEDTMLEYRAWNAGAANP